MIDDEYVSVLPVVDLPGLTKAAYDLIAALRQQGAINAADIMERSLVDLFTRLEGIGKAMALRGEQLVKDEEEATRVRPDTGEDPSVRMTTYFKCDIFPGLPGWVGYINKQEIDDSPADWWWTNELGYSGHVGRELHGYYYDAGWSGPTRPEAQSGPGEHPLFGPTGPMGPTMTINEPIPARRFALNALNKLDAEWNAAVRAALEGYEIAFKALMVGEMQVIAGFDMSVWGPFLPRFG